MKAWIGLGSNRGDAGAMVRAAQRAIAAHPDMTLLRASGAYRSEPWGYRQQPSFTNAVVEVETSLQPPDLLPRLLQVEQRLGRCRGGRRWGPRAIDIDLLLCEALIVLRENLVVPHPRMHRREFVLRPLAELDPGLVIPGRGTVGGCLARIGTRSVWLLDEAHGSGVGREA